MYRDVDREQLPHRGSVAVGRLVIASIGIDRYVTWPLLSNAVSDARSAARLFEQLGFVQLPPPLINGAATRDAMHRLVTGDLVHLSPDDSLVLFFAGHGYTHATEAGGALVKTGYVIPVDAAHHSDNAASTWLRLDNWLSDIARLPPRHILVIIDACYSGCALDSLHKWRDGAPLPTREFEALNAKRSRRVITSALGDQRALDGGPYPGHSLFTGCMIEALSGGLAAGGQQMTTGRELGQYIQRRVTAFPGSTQTPDSGAFELDDRGDIVVPLFGVNTTSVSARWPTIQVRAALPSVPDGPVQPSGLVVQVAARPATSMDAASQVPRRSVGGGGSDRIDAAPLPSHHKRCGACNAVLDVRAEICPCCRVRQISGQPARSSWGRPAPSRGTAARAASTKDRTTAGVLALLFGAFGLHKFYLGQRAVGMSYLIFSWTFIPMLAGFVEGVRLLTMSDEAFARAYG